MTQPGDGCAWYPPDPDLRSESGPSGLACEPCASCGVHLIELDQLGLGWCGGRQTEQSGCNQDPQRQGCKSIPGMARVFVGLGSNLGDRESTLRAAVGRLRGLPDVDVRRVSRLRDTDPVGPVEQPRFLNGVVELQTGLSARMLLGALLELERAFGRDRTAVPAQGPRTLDLDLLLYDDETIEEPGLQVPHPRLHERRFVLEPLVELDPALEVPGRGPVHALLAELDST